MSQPEPVIEYACTVEIRVQARSVSEARIKLDRAVSVSYRLDAITPTQQPDQGAEQ